MATPRSQAPCWIISSPGFLTKRSIDYKSIGEHIDRILAQHFLGKKILLRCMGSKDHKKTAQQLIEIIRESGTDRYDVDRKMMFHEFYKKHSPDIFAIPLKITKNQSQAAKILKEFYKKTAGDRKKGVRADIITIYDPKKMQMQHHVYEGQKESDCFVFKDSAKKQRALLGVIRIDSKRIVSKKNGAT